MEGKGSQGKLPLEGVRVLDSTYVFGLPYAGGLLADMGAEVIKVEGPNRTDSTRTGGTVATFPDNEPGAEWWDRASIYNLLNRGKRSLTLDLRSDQGRALFRELVGISDVVMENYTPRVMRDWGLDYASLRRVRPDVVMVSNTGYGHGDGPYSGYAAQATTQEGTHGLCWVTGYAGGPPSKAGASFVDFLATWSSIFAIGAALRHRLLTGEGQWIDLGMYQLGVTCISEYLMDCMVNGRQGQRMGNRHPWRAPQGCYPTVGADRWIVLSVGTDTQWQSLCRAMGRPELSQEPRYSTLMARTKNHDELDKLIGRWTATQDRYELMESLQSAGIPAVPVLDGRETHLNPHFRERGFLERIVFPSGRGVGDRYLMGQPYKFSKTPLSIKGPAPTLGQDNQWAVSELLGLAQEDYDSLAQSGIIGTVPQSGEPTPTMPMETLVARGILAGWDPDYQTKLNIS